MSELAPHNPSLRADYQKHQDNLDDSVLQLDRQAFQRLANLGYHPSIVFDIGASDGVWSFYMKQVLPQANFHLFEPLIDHSPDYRQFMEETLRIYPSFSLHKYALGDRQGNVAMTVFDNILASSCLSVTPPDQETRLVEVPMLRLDEAMQKLNLPQPQVIKIDTQGNELSILKGATQTLAKVDVLLLECWLYRGYGPETPLLTEIANWLLPFNFRLWDVTEPYRNPEGILASLDCVFVHTNASFSKNWYY
jgi:FkbM family methyltransferase